MCFLDRSKPMAGGLTMRRDSAPAGWGSQATIALRFGYSEHHLAVYLEEEEHLRMD